MRKNDLVTVTVTDMTFDGAGIGHVNENGRDFPVFVRAAALGDTVRCRIIKVLKNYAAGIVDEILTPSADRIAPACPVAEKCGGCAFHHVSYSAELKYKTDAVRQAYKLNFPGNITVAPCVPSPEEDGYRNKLQLPLSADGKFGFYSLHSHRVVPVCDCRSGHPDFAPIVAAVEGWIRERALPPYDEASGKGLIRHLFLRRGYHSGEIMVCLTVNAGGIKEIPGKERLAEILSAFPAVKSVWVNFNAKKTNVIFGDRFRLLFGEERIFDTMNGVKFSISPRSFYQVNTRQAEAIYAAAASCLSPDDILLDLYCGIGTIGLSCAHRVKELIGIEVVPEAIEDAKKNAALNGIENARFFSSDASETLKIIASLPHKPTAVIVDPPRKGLSADAVAALKEIAPGKIVYISCNPATQARDLALLSDAYTPGEVTPYDMFPRTGHVECVVCLSREKADKGTKETNMISDERSQYKSWSNLKKQMTDFLCDSLKDKISYFYTSYHEVHNAYGRATINYCKKEMVAFSWVEMYKQEQEVSQLYSEGKKVSYGEMKRTKWMPECKLCEADFINSITIYLKTDIVASLQSDDYLLRVFAYMDRRIGKRTLVKIRDEVEKLPDWVKQFYRIRCEADGIVFPPERMTDESIVCPNKQ